MSLGVRRAPISTVWGFAHGPLDEGLDLRRDRSRKHRGVALARTPLDNPPHVGQEAHVEHSVGFIQDQVFGFAQSAMALAQVVQQPARGGDDDINAALERIDLAAIAHAAKHDHGAQPGEAGEIADGGFDLGGQFAGRFQDQEARSRGMLAKLGEDRQCEGGGLAGARLRTANDIPAFQD